MSEKTLKLDGWAAQTKPGETNDMTYHRQFLVEIVYGLYYEKKQLLATMSMPPQPISLLEIYKEYDRRVNMLKSIKEWKHTRHGKRWIDRRVNEISCPKYYKDGIPKVAAASAGLYMPNPSLFRDAKNV